MIGVDILFYISILLVSITSSSFIANRIFHPRIIWKSIKLRKLSNSIKNFFLTTIILSSLSSVGIYKSLEYFQNKNHIYNKEIAEKKAILLKLEYEKRRKAEELLNTQKRQEKIFETIQQYIHSDFTKDLDRIDTFYHYPLRKYYTLYNVDRAKVQERIKYYWRHNSTPEFIISYDNTEIIQYKMDSSVVTIRMKETDSELTFLKIRLDSNLKIYSIGNYILRNADE